MTSVRRLFVLAAVAGLLIFLPGCKSTKPGGQGPQYVMLTYNNGNCQQNGSSGVIDVVPNQAVIYQGASALSQFQIQFSSCPFASCPVSSPNGNSVNVGQPNTGAAGNTYYYSGMTINNQQCNDIGPLGVRVWPGP